MNPGVLIRIKDHGRIRLAIKYRAAFDAVEHRSVVCAGDRHGHLVIAGIAVHAVVAVPDRDLDGPIPGCGIIHIGVLVGEVLKQRGNGRGGGAVALVKGDLQNALIRSAADGSNRIPAVCDEIPGHADLPGVIPFVMDVEEVLIRRVARHRQELHLEPAPVEVIAVHIDHFSQRGSRVDKHGRGQHRAPLCLHKRLGVAIEARDHRIVIHREYIYGDGPGHSHAIVQPPVAVRQGKVDHTLAFWRIP